MGKGLRRGRTKNRTLQNQGSESQASSPADSWQGRSHDAFVSFGAVILLSTLRSLGKFPLLQVIGHGIFWAACFLLQVQVGLRSRLRILGSGRFDGFPLMYLMMVVDYVAAAFSGCQFCRLGLAKIAAFLSLGMLSLFSRGEFQRETQRGQSKLEVSLREA